MTAIDLTREGRAERYPSLWRAMTPEEAVSLDHGQPVAMMHREMGTVEVGALVTAGPFGVVLRLRGGALFSFNHESCISDDGEWALIVCGEHNNDDLTTALRASLEVGKLIRRATDLRVESELHAKKADALLADAESFHDTPLAAYLIYKASSPLKVSFPRFYESNDVALADIRRMAALEAAGATDV